jgi:hypothetical protein
MKKFILISLMALSSTFAFGADSNFHPTGNAYSAAPTLVRCPICQEVMHPELSYSHTTSKHREAMLEFKSRVIAQQQTIFQPVACPFCPEIFISQHGADPTIDAANHGLIAHPREVIALLASQDHALTQQQQQSTSEFTMPSPSGYGYSPALQACPHPHCDIIIPKGEEAKHLQHHAAAERNLIRVPAKRQTVTTAQPHTPIAQAPNPHSPPAEENEGIMQCPQCHILMLKSEENTHRHQRLVECDCGKTISMDAAWKNKLQCNHAVQQPEAEGSPAFRQTKADQLDDATESFYDPDECPYCSDPIPHTVRIERTHLGPMPIVREISALAYHIAQQYPNLT